MTWYQDMEHCGYFNLEDTTKLRAIGWLERDHSFPKQVRVDDNLLALIFKLAINPWQPVLFLGGHDCSLCGGPGGPDKFTLDGETVRIGTSNIFIPYNNVVFVAPSMILHYMKAHGYRPPDPFLDAVKTCPPMGSPEYLDEIVRAAGKGVLRCVRRTTQ